MSYMLIKPLRSFKIIPLDLYFNSTQDDGTILYSDKNSSLFHNKNGELYAKNYKTIKKRY